MQVKEWFRHFKEGRMSVESDDHSGMPVMRRNKLMIEKVRSAMLDNWRITSRSVMSCGFALVW